MFSESEYALCLSTSMTNDYTRKMVGQCKFGKLNGNNDEGSRNGRSDRIILLLGENKLSSNFEEDERYRLEQLSMINFFIGLIKPTTNIEPVINRRTTCKHKV